MLDIQVIDDPAAATVALEPMRSRLLSELAAPASAATLAARVGLARQKVNYHLNALEAHGLVRLAQERKWGGLTERLLVATAASYVVSSGPWAPRRGSESKDRQAVRELSHRPGRTGRPRGGRSCSSRERVTQTPRDAGGRYRGSLPVTDGSRGIQPRTRRSHRETRFEISRRICARRPRASTRGRGASPPKESDSKEPS